MYEDCQGTEYAVPGSVPVLCQWEHVLFGAGILRMTIGRCRYLGSFFSKLLYPVVKGADSNAVLAAPVNVCHALVRHSLISFNCSSFGTRDFLVFAMMLSSIIVVVVVK